MVGVGVAVGVAVVVVVVVAVVKQRQPTAPLMWADVSPYITAKDWLTLAQVQQRGKLSLGRVKQGLGVGRALGMTEERTERVVKPNGTSWKRRLYRLKEGNNGTAENGQHQKNDSRVVEGIQRQRSH